MSEKIISKPSNDNYRNGFERIFGKDTKQIEHPYFICPHCKKAIEGKVGYQVYGSQRREDESEFYKKFNGD